MSSYFSFSLIVVVSITFAQIGSGFYGFLCLTPKFPVAVCFTPDTYWSGRDWIDVRNFHMSPFEEDCLDQNNWKCCKDWQLFSEPTRVQDQEWLGWSTRCIAPNLEDQCSKHPSTPPVRNKKSKRIYGGGVEVPVPDCELIVHGNGALAKISTDSNVDNQVADFVHPQNTGNNGNPLISEITAHGDGDDNQGNFFLENAV